MKHVIAFYHSEKELAYLAIRAFRINSNICSIGELKEKIKKIAPHRDGDYAMIENSPRIDKLIGNLVSHKKFLNTGLVEYENGVLILTDYGLSATTQQINDSISAGYARTRRSNTKRSNFTSPDVDSYDDAPEGERERVTIWRRKRDQKLAAERRQWYKDQDLHGVIRCCACGWSSPDQIKNDIVEIHHTKPVSQMKEGDKTSKEDLIALCPNCHRIAHIRKKPLPLDKIKKIISYSH